MELKPYMGYSREGGSSEGAVLIFAHNVKEAKPIAFKAIQDWFDTEYIDVAIRWLKNSDFLFKDADQEKLKAGIAHSVDDITSCDDCDNWGERINEQGRCVSCQDEMDENKKLDEKFEKQEVSN